MVHSILSRVDYCNSLYICLPAVQTNKLQKLINAATRYIFNITGKKRFQHITPYLKELHFLPCKYRVSYKICLLVYKCIYYNSPPYLTELINIRQPNVNRLLRKDNDKLLLSYMPFERQNYRSRGLSCVAPSLWNGLPLQIRNSKSITEFKTKLKTYYFNKW